MLLKNPNKRHLGMDFEGLNQEQQALSRIISNKIHSQVGTTLSTNPVFTHQH